MAARLGLSTGLRFSALPEWNGGSILVSEGGVPIGLSRVISCSDELELIRKKPPEGSRWIPALAAFGLSFRHFRALRSALKCKNLSTEDLEKQVIRGMECFGGFKVDKSLTAVLGFFHEMKLLFSCGYWILSGNSVRYEFGYRWFYQTQYDEDFKREMLEFLDVSVVPSNPQEFASEALLATASDADFDYGSSDMSEPTPPKLVEVLRSAADDVQRMDVVCTDMECVDDFFYEAELKLAGLAGLAELGEARYRIFRVFEHFYDLETDRSGACCSEYCVCGPGCMETVDYVERIGLDVLHSCYRFRPPDPDGLPSKWSSPVRELRGIPVEWASPSNTNLFVRSPLLENSEFVGTSRTLRWLSKNGSAHEYEESGS